VPRSLCTELIYPANIYFDYAFIYIKMNNFGAEKLTRIHCHQ